MKDFLIKHKLINPSQHGFLKARSCLTNLLCIFEEITKWVDDGSPVDVIYLDLQKAFDKVPPQRLILMLKPHGMGNSIINWIEKWLTDRRRRVVVDSNIFFEIKEGKITRGHNFTLVKKQSRLDVRKFSFSQRTINVWNKLST